MTANLTEVTRTIIDYLDLVRVPHISENGSKRNESSSGGTVLASCSLTQELRRRTLDLLLDQLRQVKVQACIRRLSRRDSDT
jgi:hypothetical protein